MATFSEKIKRALADLEAVSKSLDALDRDQAELMAVGTMLDARRAELAETEQRLQQTRDATVQAGNEHAHWQELHSRERTKGNSEIDALQTTLQALDVKVKEAQAKHDNIVAGIAALSQRLKV
jgi:hypothetical protein